MSLHGGQVGILHASAVGLLLAAWSGCGGSYDSSVRGTATLNQAPLQNGTVTFVNQASGPSAYGLIESDGSYSVMTGREEGLPSGSYVVTVAANKESIPSAKPGQPPTPGKPITPAWYRDPAKTPLKYTVTPGKNTINLELTTQPPAGAKPAGRR
jgi:hypothetical protein